MSIKQMLMASDSTIKEALPSSELGIAVHVLRGPTTGLSQTSVVFESNFSALESDFSVSDTGIAIGVRTGAASGKSPRAKAFI
jgi:hypothetical protein